MSTRRARLDRADGALLRPGSDMAWPPTPEEFGRLRETLAWVAARSSYYRRVFDAAGVRPDTLARYDEFRRRVPLTLKTNLVENQRAHPPFGEFLAARRPGRRAPRRGLHSRLGCPAAEALTPAPRREAEATFGIGLYAHCGEAQIGPLAGECRLHDGMHLHARDLFCEFLDVESGEPVEPGGTGELVATQLRPRPLPLARYAPRDVFHLLPGASACRNPALRLRFGR